MKYLDLNDYAAEREAMMLAELPAPPTKEEMEILQHRARMQAWKIVREYPKTEAA